MKIILIEFAKAKDYYAKDIVIIRDTKKKDLLRKLKSTQL